MNDSGSIAVCYRSAPTLIAFPVKDAYDAVANVPNFQQVYDLYTRAPYIRFRNNPFASKFQDIKF